LFTFGLIELGEQLLRGVALAREEFLMAFPDSRADSRVTNLAIILLLVGRELWDNRNDAAGDLMAWLSSTLTVPAWRLPSTIT
jgi:hypothetical protein